MAFTICAALVGLPDLHADAGAGAGQRACSAKASGDGATRWSRRWRGATGGRAAVAARGRGWRWRWACWLFSARCARSAALLGTEFLPQLDEGVIWIRANLTPGTSVEKSAEIAARYPRADRRESPEVRSVTSQTGRAGFGHRSLRPQPQRDPRRAQPVFDLAEGKQQGGTWWRSLSHAAAGEHSRRRLQLHAADHRHGDGGRDGLFGRSGHHLGRSGPGAAARRWRPRRWNWCATDSRGGGYGHRAGGRPAAAAHRTRAAGAGAAMAQCGGHPGGDRAGHRRAHRSGDARGRARVRGDGAVRARGACRLRRASATSWCLRPRAARCRCRELAEIAWRTAPASSRAARTSGRSPCAPTSAAATRAASSPRRRSASPRHITAAARLPRGVGRAVRKPGPRAERGSTSYPAGHDRRSSSACSTGPSARCCHAGLVLINVPFSMVGGILALYLRGINLSVSASVGFVSLFGVAVMSGVLYHRGDQLAGEDDRAARCMKRCWRALRAVAPAAHADPGGHAGDAAGGARHAASAPTFSARWPRWWWAA